MTSGRASRPITRLDTLTALRFFAAALVVATHTVRKTIDLPGLNNVADIGFVGVGFFFVLSGFVLTWAARPGTSIVTFYRRRAARIIPLHVLTWACAVTIAGVFGTAAISWAAAASALVLLQAWVPSPNFYWAANSPSWSLSCEAFFYAIFPAALWVAHKRNLRWRAIVAVALCAIMMAGAAWSVLALTPDQTDAYLYVQPVYRAMEFLLGVLLAFSFRRSEIPKVSFAAASVFAVGMLMLTALLGTLAVHGPIQFIFPVAAADLIMLPAWIVLMAAAVHRDLASTPPNAVWSMFRRLGEWSFALYLVHVPLKDLIFGLYPPPYGHVVGIAVETLLITLAVGIAGFLHICFEQPLERRFSGRGRSRDVHSDDRVVPADRSDRARPGTSLTTSDMEADAVVSGRSERRVHEVHLDQDRVSRP